MALLISMVHRTTNMKLYMIVDITKFTYNLFKNIFKFEIKVFFSELDTKNCFKL